MLVDEHVVRQRLENPSICARVRRECVGDLSHEPLAPPRHRDLRSILARSLLRLLERFADRKMKLYSQPSRSEPLASNFIGEVQF